MSFIKAVLALVVATLFSTVASGQNAACTVSPDVACTEQGAVRGAVQGATMAFKGIPYAAPPVGSLRWKPPTPPARWDGARDGSHFGAICPQIVDGEVKGNEDCLYINVWRPREKADRPLPVMVWLRRWQPRTVGEGTDNFAGVTYNGEHLVPHGVVFVSYNLRVGVLGFLSHAALVRNVRRGFPGITAASIRLQCCNGSIAILRPLVAMRHVYSSSAPRLAAETSAR